MSSTTSNAGFSASYIAYNEGHTLARISFVMIPISGIITAARFWSRKRKHISYGWDDWLTLISLFLLWFNLGIAITAVYWGGVGRNMAVVLAEDKSMYKHALLCLFMTEMVYGTCLCTIKAAILLMYRRIFPTRLMEIGGWGIGAITIAFWLAGILISVFQCRPIRKTWDPFMEGGTCLNKYQFFLGSSISNIITDAFILILPVLEVLRLQIRFGQKIAIAGIFLLGSLYAFMSFALSHRRWAYRILTGTSVVVCSCIRLKSIIDLLHRGDNFTRLITPSWNWTVIELTIGLLCACLPTMQPVVHLLFGRFFSTPSNKSGDTSELVTIGGGTNLKHSAKPKVRDSFMRLHGNDSTEEPVLWPSTYAGDLATTIEGAQDDSSSTQAAIPLDTIKVQKAITWVESKSNV